MLPQTFIFCIGAAKSGTSWLFDYLFHRDDCHFPAVKELHYWDVLESGNGAFFRAEADRRIAWLKGRREITGNPRTAAYQERSIADIGAWHQAFDGETRNDAAYLSFLGEGREGARLIGDFTPSYALLSEKSFRAMSHLMARVKFVFLMREPVDRLWSQMRMDAGGDVHAQDARLANYLGEGERNLRLRSNYRRTTKRLLAVVPRANLHLELYERLFSPEAIERLCTFLGLAPQPAQFGKVINDSPGAPLAADVRRQLEATLRPQYNFVSELMGGLPAEWTDRMVTA